MMPLILFSDDSPELHVKACPFTYFFIGEGDFITWRNGFEEALLNGTAEPAFYRSPQSILHMIQFHNARIHQSECENRLLNSELAQERLAKQTAMRAYLLLRRSSAATAAAAPAAAAPLAPAAAAPVAEPGPEPGPATVATTPPWRAHAQPAQHERMIIEDDDTEGSSEDWVPNTDWWGTEYTRQVGYSLCKVCEP